MHRIGHKRKWEMTALWTWYNYCREAVVLYQIDQQEALGKIVGIDEKVQIAECEFGKRKYNKVIILI